MNNIAGPEDTAECRRCGSVDLAQTVMEHGQHYARLDCNACGCFVKWLPKPDADKIKRPAAHRNLVHAYSNGYCEMCLRREADLPKNETLEAQHIREYADGGSQERNNIWIVCTGCHKLIHWRRTWGLPAPG